MTNKIEDDEDSSLESIRARIDEIDDQLYNLLVKRFSIASKLGRNKLSEGSMGQAGISSSSLPALRPQRENEIIQRILAKTNTKAEQEDAPPPTLILRLWRLLMSATAFKQNPYAIAYLRSDLLCAICRGACFTPQVRLLPQDSEAEVIAILSQEPQAFALVSLNPAHKATEESTARGSANPQTLYPWWCFLFSTHAPRILQAMPIMQENIKENSRKENSRKENPCKENPCKENPCKEQFSNECRTRVLLLARTPNSFIDEAACTKYFIVRIAETKPIPDEARCRELIALPAGCLLLLARHDNMLLIECRQSAKCSSASIVAALQKLGEARHIGSTHDDWLHDDCLHDDCLHDDCLIDSKPKLD